VKQNLWYAESMKELVEEIAKALVDKPEDVLVEEVTGNHTCVLKLKVAKEDVGKIIGKKGANANAIRTLLEASGGKNNKRFILEILE
jgi:predicted RNA-binding protein YlqC (UPF0109 family)